MEELTAATTPIIITDLMASQRLQARSQLYQALPLNNSPMAVPRRREVSQPILLAQALIWE
tara:strand:+ start:465 stop:647 length:183 start_codon:yes stop_codon:yes gene_type:complete